MSDHLLNGQSVSRPLSVNPEFLEGVIAERDHLRDECERLREALNTAIEEGHCWEGHAWADGFHVGCECCEPVREAANSTLRPEDDSRG